MSRAERQDEDHRAEALVGTVVSGRYRLDELLALGGMGAVFRASHVHMHKLSAIKILHPTRERGAELVARFRREAIVGAHLQHPNIAAATDFGELDDGSHFLVTEFVHGATLHARMLDGPIEGELATRIALQIAFALGALHEQGILHRDLKPRNVMIADDAFATVKVIDFGLAKVDLGRLPMTPSARGGGLEALTEGGVIFGTVAYLPPEAALGMDVMDARADLYALGVVLYEMLSGRHLFDGSPGELFIHHRKTPPMPFAQRAPGVSIHPALEAVVMKLLSKEKTARHASALELVAALDAARAAAGYPPFAPVRAASSSRPAHPSAPPRGPASLAVPRAPRLPEIGRDSDRTPLRAGESSGRMSDATPLRFSDRPTQPRLPGDPPRPPAPTIQDAPAGRGRQAALAIGLLALFLGMVAALVYQPWVKALPAATATATAPGTMTATAPVTATAPAPVTAPVTATTTAPATAPVTATAPAPGTETATEPAPEPVAPEGAETARLLRQATASRRWDRAGELLVQLLDAGGADELATDATRVAARDTAAELEDQGHGRGDPAFRALVGAGAPGLDVLYDIVQTKGKTRAQARAEALVKRPENLAAASPALRIAIELRNAPCDKKMALFDRALSDGDVRTLAVLETFGVGCFRKDKRLMATIKKLKQRLARP